MFFFLLVTYHTDSKCFNLGLDDDDDSNDESISYQCCPKPADKDITLSVINRKKIISKDGSCFVFPKETEKPKKQIATKKDDTKTKTKGIAAKKVTNKKGNTVDNTMDLIGTEVGWMKLIRCIFSN